MILLTLWMIAGSGDLARACSENVITENSFRITGKDEQGAYAIELTSQPLSPQTNKPVGPKVTSKFKDDDFGVLYNLVAQDVAKAKDPVSAEQAKPLVMAMQGRLQYIEKNKDTFVKGRVGLAYEKFIKPMLTSMSPETRKAQYPAMLAEEKAKAAKGYEDMIASLKASVAMAEKGQAKAAEAKFSRALTDYGVEGQYQDADTKQLIKLGDLFPPPNLRSSCQVVTRGVAGLDVLKPAGPSAAADPFLNQTFGTRSGR